MPKQRWSGADALELVKAKIGAAGGVITHDALIKDLDAEGNGEVALYLVSWATKTGPLQAKIDPSKPPAERLTYRVRPEGSEG